MPLHMWRQYVLLLFESLPRILPFTGGVLRVETITQSECALALCIELSFSLSFLFFVAPV